MAAERRAIDASSSLKDLFLPYEDGLKGFLDDPDWERYWDDVDKEIYQFFKGCMKVIAGKLKANSQRSRWKAVLENCENAFLNLGTKLADILEIILPQTPEYQMPYRALMVLFTVSSNYFIIVVKAFDRNAGHQYMAE